MSVVIVCSVSVELGETVPTTEISVSVGGVSAVEAQRDERDRGGLSFSLAGAALVVSLETVGVVPSAPCLVSDVPVAGVSERVTEGGIDTLGAEVETSTAGAAHVLGIELTVVVPTTGVSSFIPVAAISSGVSKEVAIPVGIGVGAVVGDAATALTAHRVGKELFGVV